MTAKKKSRAKCTKGEFSSEVKFVALPGGVGYAVHFRHIPEIVTSGGTLEEARAMARDALRCHLAGLRQDRKPFPPQSGGPPKTVVETITIKL